MLTIKYIQCDAISSALHDTQFIIKYIEERSKDEYEDYEPDLSIFSKYERYFAVSDEPGKEIDEGKANEEKTFTVKHGKAWRIQNRFAYLLTLVEVKLAEISNPFGISKLNLLC
jgi:hypothetical protein